MKPDAVGGSVTRLLQKFVRGSGSAFGGVFRRFYSVVVRDAGRRIANRGLHFVDQEELAADALHSLWRCVQKAREEPIRLSDRRDLLRLLGSITEQKIQRACRDLTRQKRDARRTVQAADISTGCDEERWMSLVVGRELPPEWQVEFRDTLADWLAFVRPRSRQVALLCLDGFEDREIAGQLGCSLRTVERELSEIRSAWSAKAQDGGFRPPMGS